MHYLTPLLLFLE